MFKPKRHDAFAAIKQGTEIVSKVHRFLPQVKFDSK